jgi:hypothetical protein
VTRGRPKARTLDVVERITRSERSSIEVCIDESEETGTFAVVRHRVRRYPSSPWFPLHRISFGADEARAVGEALIKAAELIEDETKPDGPDDDGGAP